MCRRGWQRADPVEGAGCLTSGNQGSWESHHPWNLTPHPREGGFWDGEPRAPPTLSPLLQAWPCPAPWASCSQNLPSGVKEAAPTGLLSAADDKGTGPPVLRGGTAAQTDSGRVCLLSGCRTSQKLLSRQCVQLDSVPFGICVLCPPHHPPPPQKTHTHLLDGLQNTV